MVNTLLVIAVLLVIFGIPASITWMKGQREAFVLGFVVMGLIWLIAACRLARPSSWWANRFYGPKKMQRAFKRFGPDSGALS